jgi:hypothetical protein
MPPWSSWESLLSTNEGKQYRWDWYKCSRKIFSTYICFNSLKTSLNLCLSSSIDLKLFLIFKIRGVLSLKTYLEGGNLVKLIMHAPWCIIGCPPDNFHQDQDKHGWAESIALQEIHGGMWSKWSKGAWTWLKARASSGRTNNANKGVDESVWVVQLVEHAGTKVTKGRWSCWEKEPSQGPEPPRPAL